MFMISSPKISQTICGIKNICLHFLGVFYLTQPSSEQNICFDFKKQNSVRPNSILRTFDETNKQPHWAVFKIAGNKKAIS